MIEVQVQTAMQSAALAARQAAEDYFKNELGGRDQFACGFAWVNTYEKGTTKLVRELKKHGFSKAYGGGYQWWNPSKMHVQNVECLEAGAVAAAKVLTEQLGVKFYAGSRLD